MRASTAFLALLEIRRYIDWDLWELSRKAEAAEVETVNTVLDRWGAISSQGRE